MIYEQLKSEVAELTRLEANRGFKFVQETVTTQSIGDVVLESPDFSIKLICELGWAYVDIAPAGENRWVEASSLFVYLGMDMSTGYRYGRAPLPVQLALIDDLYDSIIRILNDPAEMCMVEKTAKKRLEDFMARLTGSKI